MKLNEAIKILEKDRNKTRAVLRQDPLHSDVDYIIQYGWGDKLWLYYKNHMTLADIPWGPIGEEGTPDFKDEDAWIIETF